MRDINPGSPENQRATRSNEAHIKMLQMKMCSECGQDRATNVDGKCDTCHNSCPMCGNEVDEDIGVCFTCKETVR